MCNAFFSLRILSLNHQGGSNLTLLIMLNVPNVLHLLYELNVLNVLILLYVLNALTACYFPLSFSPSPAAAPEKMAALSTDASNTIFFEFQPKSLRAKVLSAQLFVYVRKPPSSSRGQTLLLVYRVRKNRFNYLLHVCTA